MNREFKSTFLCVNHETKFRGSICECTRPPKNQEDAVLANEEAQHAGELAEQGVAEAKARHFEQFGISASSSSSSSSSSSKKQKRNVVVLQM